MANDIIGSGQYDDLFELFTEAMCHFEAKGVLGFEMLSKLHLNPVTNEFVSKCLDLIIGGYDDFYYDFTVNLDYEIKTRSASDKVFTQLYLAKTLAGLLRKRCVKEMYYLIQHHCSLELSQHLLNKLKNTFPQATNPSQHPTQQ